MLDAAPDTIRPRRGPGRPPREPGAGVHRLQREQITYNEALNGYRAYYFARYELDAAPNIHATIHWSLVQGDLAPQTRITNLLNRMGGWLRRKRLAPVWIYAREIASAKGEHLHLMVHVPHELASSPAGLAELTAMFEGWVAKDGNLVEAARSRAVKVTTAVGAFLQKDLLGYLLKEAPPHVLKELGIDPRYIGKASGGTILGKRIKVSHAIGAAAQSTYYASKGRRALDGD